MGAAPKPLLQIRTGCGPAVSPLSPPNTPAPPAPLSKFLHSRIHKAVPFSDSRVHNPHPGIPWAWTASQRPGICHYSAVVPEVLGNLAWCFQVWGS